MAEFKKKWRNATDKIIWTQGSFVNFPHNVNDPNSSHYLKSETYSMAEADVLFEPIISGIGTTEDYYRGDRTWADFTTKVRSSINADYPLTYVSGTGVFGLGYNTSNLKLTSNELDTIQDITTTSEPTFDQLNLNNAATGANDAVRADRSVWIDTTSPLTGGDNKDLTGDVKWSLDITSSDLLGITNQVIVLSGVSTILGSSDVTLSLPQDIHTGASPTFVTAKLSALADGYLPYHVNDATGLTNSPIYTTGTNLGIGTSLLTEKVNLVGNFKHSGDYSFFNNFTSGWAGTGWRLDYGVTNTNTATLEIDDLWVRGTMSVYELLINQIRATNGSLFVTSSARVEEVVSAGEPEVIRFEDITGHGVTPFAVDDIIMCQRVSLDSQTVVKRIVREVVTLSGLQASVQATAGGPSDTGDIEEGDDYVRIGNLGTYPERQGTIYLTADDSNAPYIDVLDDVASWADWQDIEKNKARIGNLVGVSTSPFGQLSGYGIYSGNIYLTGNANVWGTISVGDAYGFDPVFYAGRMQKNSFMTSEGESSGTAGFPMWTWESGSGYVTNTTDDTGPGGEEVTITRVRKSVNSGSVLTIVQADDARCWIGEDNFENLTWNISFWAKAEDATLTGNHTCTLEFPDGTTLDTVVINMTEEWQRFSFEFECGANVGAVDYIRVFFPLIYSATHHYRFWGFQVEPGATASIYQRTDGYESQNTGYGMWASKGGFGGTMQNPRVAVQDEGVIIRKDDSGATTWAASDTISMGYSGATWGIIGKDGADTVFELGSTNKIAGWTFTDIKLEAPTVGTATFSLNADSSGSSIGALLYINPPPNGGDDYVSFGSIYDGTGSIESAKFGIAYKNASNVYFELTNTVKTIAGWSFDTEKFYTVDSTNKFALNKSGTPYISSSQTGFEIWDIATPKMFIGTKSGLGTLSAGLDWGMTTADVLTIMGTVTGSKFTTGTVFSGTTDTFVAMKDDTGDDPVFTCSFYGSSTNSKYLVSAPKTASNSLLYAYAKYGANASNVEIKFDDTTNVRMGVYVEGFITGRYRGDFSGTPSADLREGDIYYDTSGAAVKIYTSAGWKTIG